MPAGIAQRLRVAMHVGVIVEPIALRVRRDELARQRIIIPRLVIIQPRRAVGVLVGEAPTARHGSAAVTGRTIGTIQNACRGVAAAIQGDGGAAQPVAGQERDGAVDPFGDAVPARGVIRRGDGAQAAGGDLFDAADIGDAAVAAAAGNLLRDAVARAVIQVARRARRRLSARSATPRGALRCPNSSARRSAWQSRGCRWSVPGRQCCNVRSEIPSRGAFHRCHLLAAVSLYRGGARAKRQDGDQPGALPIQWEGSPEAQLTTKT